MFTRANAWAQESSSPTEVTEIEALSLEELLNPRVSIGTKSVTTLEQTPSIVTVFTREDIERLGVKQLIELLRYVPGFYEVSGQLERNVAIRGIHAASPSHFVVLLDGMPMNDFVFGSGSPDNFSLEYAERVEILRGPGSAIYGANALMGVVSIISRKPAEGTHARSTVSVGTPGHLRVDVNLSASFGKGAGFYGAASFWRQDGTPFAVAPGEDVLTPGRGQNIADGIQIGENLTQPLAGATVQVNGYKPSFNVFAKYQHEDGSAVRLFAARSQLRLQRTYRQSLFMKAPFTQTPLYANERLVLDAEKRWGSRDSWGQITLRPSLLLVTHELRSQALAPAYYEAAAREEVPMIYGWSGRDIRVGPSLEYSIGLPDFSIFKRTAVVAGVQSEYNVVTDYRATQCSADRDRRFPPSVFTGADNEGSVDLVCTESLMLREGVTIDPFGRISNSGGSPFFGDGDEIRVGSFLQLTTFLPLDIGLVAGARVDYNVTYAPEVSPRVALVAPLGAAFYSKLQFATAFVYPAFLYRNGNALSDYSGNPDIQPQRVRTLEGLIGFKASFLRLELSGYYNHVSGFITFDLPRNARSGQYRFSNQGNLTVVGAEATALMRALDGKLAIDAHGTFARPLPSTSDAFLVDGQLGGPTKYPQALGLLAISGRPFDRLQLGAVATFSTSVKQKYNPEVQFEAIPGTDGQPYSSSSADELATRDLTFDATATYDVSLRWRAALAITNVLGRPAHRPGSVLVPYVSEVRRVTFSLSYAF